MKRFLKDTRGNFAISFAILAVPVLGAVSMGIDYANMNRVKSDSQQTLDAAGLNAAQIGEDGGNDTAIQTGANSFYGAQFNWQQAGVKGTPPSVSFLGRTEGADGSATYAFTIAMPYSNHIRVPGVGFNGTTLNVRTEVVAMPSTPACLFALNNTMPRALTVTGNAGVDTGNCIVGSNSNASDSVYIGGSGELDAACVRSSGGIYNGGGLTTDCARNAVNARRSLDPFRNIPEPIASSYPPRSDPKKNDTVVQPGYYPSGLSLEGTKNLQPGIYVVDGGLDMKGTITGDGVFIFIKSGDISVNATADITLTAMKSGPYSGLSFMGARNNTEDMRFNGGAKMEINGFMYFAGAEVIYQGNSGATSTCLRIIADKIDMTGNTDIKFDCKDKIGDREALLAGGFRISR